MFEVEDIATTSGVFYTFRSESYSILLSECAPNPEMANYSDGVAWSFLTGSLKKKIRVTLLLCMLLPY